MTKAADVWSFGILLLEAYLGRRAWSGYSTFQVLSAITSGKLVAAPPHINAGTMPCAPRSRQCRRLGRRSLPAYLPARLRLLQARCPFRFQMMRRRRWHPCWPAACTPTPCSGPPLRTLWRQPRPCWKHCLALACNTLWQAPPLRQSRLQQWRQQHRRPLARESSSSVSRSTLPRTRAPSCCVADLPSMRSRCLSRHLPGAPPGRLYPALPTPLAFPCGSPACLPARSLQLLQQAQRSRGCQCTDFRAPCDARSGVFSFQGQ